MLQGGEPEPGSSRPGPMALVTPSTVAGALAIAAVLAAAGIVLEVSGYAHNTFGERVEVAGLLSMSAIGVVLAAAVALSCTDPVSERLSTSAPWRIWAYDALGVISAATVAAALWGIVLIFSQGTDPGATAFDIARFEVATGELAALLLALAAIVVIARARLRSSIRDVDGEADDSAPPTVFADDLVGPTIGCLLAAGIVSLVNAVTSAFTHSSVSTGDRIAGVALSISQNTAVFIAFALVVLLALARRPRVRDPETDPVIRATVIIGVVVAVAGVYSVYAVVVGTVRANGLITLASTSWWARSGDIATAVVAGVIGVVVVAVARRLQAPATDTQPRRLIVVSRLRAGARTTALFLAGSSVVYVAYTVLSILAFRDFGGPFNTPVSDLIAVEAPNVLVAAGLALAAALVMAARRPDVTGRDTVNDVFDATVAVVAVATVAVSAFSIWVVLSAHHPQVFLVFGGFNTAQRWHYVGTSLTAALIGAATVHLVARGRQIVADRETEREVERLDLLS